MVAMSCGIAHGMRVPAWQIGVGWKALLRQPAGAGHRDNSHQKIAFRQRPRTDPPELQALSNEGCGPALNLWPALHGTASVSRRCHVHCLRRRRQRKNSLLLQLRQNRSSRLPPRQETGDAQVVSLFFVAPARRYNFERVSSWMTMLRSGPTRDPRGAGVR
jgi:hypothetical protein